MLWWLLTARRFTEPRPINVYVIEHESGLVLFDTGQDRRSVTDPHYFPRGPLRFFYRRLAMFEIEPTDTLTVQLRTLGYDIADVSTAILSHLHQDHIGGLRELPDARIVVSAAEFASLRRPTAALNGVLANHIDLPGLDWALVDWAGAPFEPFAASHDLFGDGSLVLLPTPGHSPGSLSLLVRRAGLAPLLLVGDLTYDIDTMLDGAVPGVGDRSGLVASSAAVAALRTRMPDLVVLAAHDPAARGLLDAALVPRPTATGNAL